MGADVLCRLVGALLWMTDATAPCDSDGLCASAPSLLQRSQHRGKESLNFEQRDLPTGGVHGSMNEMPPPVASFPQEVLLRMALPDTYPCHLQAAPIDVRFNYCGPNKHCESLCGRTALTEELLPSSLAFPPWKDSFRLRMPIGSLPCCPTPPHCKGPSCKMPDALGASGDAAPTCTKFSAEANYAYMTHPNVYPAYHGWGGSYDLDVYKHWDVLSLIFGNSCSHNSTGKCDRVEPFDFAIDLGADWGSYTEKFTARKFAKDYILVDALPSNKAAFDERFGNSTFQRMWYQEQVTGWPQGKEFPHFGFLSHGLSNTSSEVLDMCDGGQWHAKTGIPCPVEVLTVDAMIPERLPLDLMERFALAQSVYVKMDLDGMDQIAIDGMRTLLSEVRGTHIDGSPRYLVNFMMLEFCSQCMAEQKQQKGYANYDLGTQVQLLESIGFEVFIIGPRYLPISHGSWAEAFNIFTKSPESRPDGGLYPDYQKLICPSGQCDATAFLTADLFAMRASHPRAATIKVALGACTESREFALQNEIYDIFPEAA